MSKPLVDSTHMLCMHIVRTRDWCKYWELLCVLLTARSVLKTQMAGYNRDHSLHIVNIQDMVLHGSLASHFINTLACLYQSTKARNICCK